MEVKSQTQILKYSRNHENLINRIERVRHVTCDWYQKFRTESYLQNAENRWLP